MLSRVHFQAQVPCVVLRLLSIQHCLEGNALRMSGTLNSTSHARFILCKCRSDHIPTIAGGVTAAPEILAGTWQSCTTSPHTIAKHEESIGPKIAQLVGSAKGLHCCVTLGRI